MGKCRVELLDIHALGEDGRTWSEDRAVLDNFCRVLGKDARFYDLLLKPAESIVTFAIKHRHVYAEQSHEAVCDILQSGAVPLCCPTYALSYAGIA
jgi:hypothetical protein